MKSRSSLTADEIKARYRKVCICRSISLGKILTVIDNGADSIEKVNEQAGTGRGDCRGTRCGPVILEILARRIGGNNGD